MDKNIKFSEFVKITRIANLPFQDEEGTEKAYWWIECEDKMGNRGGYPFDLKLGNVLFSNEEKQQGLLNKLIRLYIMPYKWERQWKVKGVDIQDK
jgi:hypothetical protein